VPADSRLWRTRHFKDHLADLGDLPEREWVALRTWLERARANPLVLPKAPLKFGGHAGQTTDVEDREESFGEAYRAPIGTQILCDFLVDRMARAITCVGLHRRDRL
jgi:hypothetical protein